MHDYACIVHNASLEGPEMFGPPKILAQLRLCLWLSSVSFPSNLCYCHRIAEQVLVSLFVCLQDFQA